MHAHTIDASPRREAIYKGLLLLAVSQIGRGLKREARASIIEAGLIRNTLPTPRSVGFMPVRPLPVCLGTDDD